MATVILMADTKAPSHAPSTAYGQPYLPYNTFASWLNAFYARQHGYEFRYYHLNEPGCSHVRWGHRHPSYCKLPAIAAAIADGFALVAFIDSDSWFSPDAPPLPTLLKGGDESGSSIALVSFASDVPFSKGPNCGFMVWRAQALPILQLWWNIDPGRFATTHDYEQHALHWVLAHLDHLGLNKEDVPLRTLNLRPLQSNASLDGSPVVHVDHTRRGERLWRLGLAILRAAALVNGAWAVRAAERMHGGAPRAEQLRRQVLDAALAVVANLRVPRHIHTGLSQSAPGRGQRRSGRQPSRRARRVHVLPHDLNASETAARLLPPVSKGAVQLLVGLPLALRSCASGLGEWQQWQANDGSMALAARPHLCLAVGQSTALAEDRSNATLAQLRPCNATRSRHLAQVGRMASAAASAEVWATPRASELQAGWWRDVLQYEGVTRPSGAVRAATDVVYDPEFDAQLKEQLERITHAWGEAPHAHAVVNQRAAKEKGVAAPMPGAGKHGLWREQHADRAKLFKPCARAQKGDKSVQDCEAWCRPQLKPRHCWKCKCRACLECGASTPLKRPANSPFTRPRSPLTPMVQGSHCLSVWHDDPIEGAPLTFMPCQSAAREVNGRASGRQVRRLRRQRHMHQQWATELLSTRHAEQYVRIRSVSVPDLCVTAHPLHIISG